MLSLFIYYTVTCRASGGRGVPPGPVGFGLVRNIARGKLYSSHSLSYYNVGRSVGRYTSPLATGHTATRDPAHSRTYSMYTHEDRELTQWRSQNHKSQSLHQTSQQSSIIIINREKEILPARARPPRTCYMYQGWPTRTAGTLVTSASSVHRESSLVLRR